MLAIDLKLLILFYLNRFFQISIDKVYLSGIWLPTSANMRTIKVAYNNVYLIVMNYERRNSASLMFLFDNVNNLTIKLRKSYNSTLSTDTKFS